MGSKALTRRLALGIRPLGNSQTRLNPSRLLSCASGRRGCHPGGKHCNTTSRGRFPSSESKAPRPTHAPQFAPSSRHGSTRPRSRTARARLRALDPNTPSSRAWGIALGGLHRACTGPGGSSARSQGLASPSSSSRASNKGGNEEQSRNPRHPFLMLERTGAA